MSRTPSDPNEVRSLGPLFAPAVEKLYGRRDPETSRKAALRAVQHDLITGDRWYALDLLKQHPGSTAKEIGEIAHGEDPESRSKEWWHVKLGRRLNELETAGLIRRDGERDGCSVWWPI